MRKSLLSLSALLLLVAAGGCGGQSPAEETPDPEQKEDAGTSSSRDTRPNTKTDSAGGAAGSGGGGGGSAGSGGGSAGSGGAGSGGSAGSGAGGTGGTTPSVDPTTYLPLKTDNKWVYTVTSVDPLTKVKTVFTKDTVVGARRAVGGTGVHKAKMAFLVTTTKYEMQNGVVRPDKTESLQDLVATRFVRYREISYSVKDLTVPTRDETYDPARLRLDIAPENLKVGATFRFTFTQVAKDAALPEATTSHTETWTVEKLDDEITVPAGTFKALRISKVGGPDAVKKTWWYAPGVGKIKEEGGQLEELKSYMLK